MQKSFFGSVLVVLILVAHTSALTFSVKKVSGDNVAKKTVLFAAPQLDLCPYCVDFMNDAINDLLQAILNGGVLGGCNGLCSYLSEQFEAAACNLICDYVGIQAFIEAINVTDPDPIYACQEIELCPIVNNGAAKIISAVVDPLKGPTGTNFNFTFEYDVTSPTGPGLIAVNVFPPDAFPFGESEFTEGQSVGGYGIEFSLSTQPSEDEPFDAGVYQVQFAVCEGDCTTDHPYGGVYAEAVTTFTITGESGSN